MNTKELFIKHQGQTSPYPSCLEVDAASGSTITDIQGKQYIDLIAGVSACTLGHCHPIILEAVTKQASKYMHIMVYGEFIQKPQLKLARLLSEVLPKTLNSTYFVNSGVEAIEASMKLAKRFTGRSQMISCKDSYHGSTHGALSIMGTETYKQKYRPLLPDCTHIVFNDINSLSAITEKTAAVILEPIQGATGFIVGSQEFMNAVRLKCNETGALLVFDEIQTCFGRTGTMFGFEQFNVVPDILCMAKGMGGGLPIGSFTCSTEIMHVLKENPMLGHITTFGGHPISCEASLATLNYLNDSDIMKEVQSKEKLIRELLVHTKIKEIRGKGLMLALEFNESTICQKVVSKGMELGIITFFFLFTDTAVRLSPPLIISESELRKACSIILKILDE